MKRFTDDGLAFERHWKFAWMIRWQRMSGEKKCFQFPASDYYTSRDLQDTWMFSLKTFMEIRYKMFRGLKTDIVKVECVRKKEED